MKGPLKILCPGLPRTGTRSLAEALRLLGYETAHYEPWRMHSRSFPHLYWDVEAAVDYPASAFWKEILREMQAPPRVIYTFRSDTKAWCRSMDWHLRLLAAGRDERWEETKAVQVTLFGEVWPTEASMARQHYQRLDEFEKTVPADRLLMLDCSSLPAASPWEALCLFLEKPIPTVAYPHLNRTERQ
jgi:hypothetical protein